MRGLRPRQPQQHLGLPGGHPEACLQQPCLLDAPRVRRLDLGQTQQELTGAGADDEGQLQAAMGTGDREHPSAGASGVRGQGSSFSSPISPTSSGPHFTAQRLPRDRLS